MKASPIQFSHFSFILRALVKLATDFLKHSLRCCDSSSLRQRKNSRELKVVSSKTLNKASSLFLLKRGDLYKHTHLKGPKSYHKY